MTVRIVLRRSLMAAVLCACGLFAAGLHAQPAANATDADREFVKKTLAAIDEENGSMAGAAEEAFVARGAGLVPALKEALPKAAPAARCAIDSALVRLEWKLDPTKLIRESVGKLPENIVSQINPALVSDESTARAFPAHRFYLVGFMQYPVAMDIPEPLASRNIFILSREGKVQLVTEGEGLTKFFLGNLAAVRDEAGVRDAAVAWLEISKEISQDGMYRFKLPINEIKIENLAPGWRATGRLTVRPEGGNSGAIGVTMSFDDKGKLTTVKQLQNLRQGMRPICQATKLLDPDPIVRKMAEQDLLIMGTAAREYIFAQRAKASPELKKEIDRVWQLILERERTAPPAE